jgi:hypothetical protein
MRRRSLLVAAGWFGAAVLVAAVGLGAISIIGAGLTSPDTTRAKSAAEVTRELGRLTPAPSAPASPSLGSAPATSPAPRAASTAKATRGGTVVARCAGTRAEIVTMTPEIGFAVHEKDSGPRAEAEGEFRGSSDDHDRVKIRVSCAGGTPQVSTENRD